MISSSTSSTAYPINGRTVDIRRMVNIVDITILRSVSWEGDRECRAPKFLVDPLEGPSMRQCGRSWNLEHDPDFQH
jgi:hypothetical protein